MSTDAESKLHPATMADGIGLVVRPLRFTDRLPQMRAFLEALGLRPRLESNAGGWLDLVAGGGMVALHSAEHSTRRAPSGLTALNFEAADIDSLAARLGAAGIPGVNVYDESYGRVLEFTGPGGAQIVVDEWNPDLYGYRAHETTLDRPPIRVVPVVFTGAPDAYSRLMSALGLTRREGGGYVTTYDAAAGARGSVLLHPPAAGMPPFAEQSAACRLAFETTEPAADVADRLRGAGFPAELVHESFGTVVHAVDGDGLTLEIHPALEAPKT